MALANIEGRKTQTRRIASFPLTNCSGLPADPERAWLDRSYESPSLGGCACLKIPYGPQDHNSHTVHRFFPKWQAGHTIYQKETFFHAAPFHHEPIFAALTVNNLYFADYAYRGKDRPSIIGDHHWTPSIFMPRESSRFTATITEVRVQRIQDITEQDAIAEGCLMDDDDHPLPQEIPHPKVGMTGWDSARDWYADLWNHINLKPSPVYGPKDKATGKRPLLHYVSHPWSLEDFHLFISNIKNPKSKTINLQSPAWLSKPLLIFPNPYVFAITYQP
jgi:hypothetical protein